MTVKRFSAGILTLIFALLIPFSAAAQNQTGDKKDTGGEMTVEELYLQNAEVGVIREQAVSINRDAKLLALDNLQDMVDRGKIDKNSVEVLYLLDYLSTEGISRQVRMNGRLINNFPMVRKQAVDILGQIGGETAKNTLLDVLSDDNETMVKSEAAYALGKIGINDNGEVSRALAQEVINQSVVDPDNNFAFSVLLSFEKLAEANNGLKDPSVFLACIQISQGNYIKMVRDKALQLLEKLRSY